MVSPLDAYLFLFLRTPCRFSCLPTMKNLISSPIVSRPIQIYASNARWPADDVVAVVSFVGAVAVARSFHFFLFFLN